MSQTNKMILIAVVATLIGSIGTFVWQSNQLPINEPVTVTKSSTTNEFLGVAKYNCKKSGGSFSKNSCVCPLEEGQTQEMMYDKDTGYCQTTYGGPGGDAFAASIGLPYGDYAFYTDIISYNCETTGGDFIHQCNCLDPKKPTYDKSTGYCK